MTLVYQSTRDENNKVTASQAILQGLATDGGDVYKRQASLKNALSVRTRRGYGLA